MFLCVYESVLCIQVCLSVTSRQAGGGTGCLKATLTIRERMSGNGSVIYCRADEGKR